MLVNWKSLVINFFLKVNFYRKFEQMNVKNFIKFIFLTIIFAAAFSTEILAQKKNSVEFFARIFLPFEKSVCKEFKPGNVILYKKPEYSTKAKTAGVGGIVEFKVDVSETGVIGNPQKLSGHPLFDEATLDTAQKVRFSPTLCDGEPKKVSALLVYVFLPEGDLDSYFVPSKLEDFTDISNKSQFYEPLLFLTENYKLTYGFSDKKFHSELPLTYGDFNYFLDSTLKLLFERAKIANKNPLEIGLFSPFNPQNLESADKILELNNKKPYAESVKNLLRTYKIAIVDVNNEFHGEVLMTDVEVKNYWQKIFGKESIPINFQTGENEERTMSRGEFALFLRESLEVLLYKVLP